VDTKVTRSDPSGGAALAAPTAPNASVNAITVNPRRSTTSSLDRLLVDAILSDQRQAIKPNQRARTPSD
jgi:hypothetical protein